MSVPPEHARRDRTAPGPDRDGSHGSATEECARCRLPAGIAIASSPRAATDESAARRSALHNESRLHPAGARFPVDTRAPPKCAQEAPCLTISAGASQHGASQAAHLLALFGLVSPRLAGSRRAEAAGRARRRRARASRRGCSSIPSARPDGSVRAGVIFTLDPGWHLYWKNPGDAGLPTRLAWRGGAGRPAALARAVGLRRGPRSSATATRATSCSRARSARGRRETLGVDVDVLACRSACIPAQLSLERPLERGRTRRGERRGAPPVRAARRGAAARPAQARFGVRVVPRRPDRDSRATLAVEACRGGAERRARVRGAARVPAFFPAEPGLRVVEARAAGGRLRLLLEREANALRPLAGRARRCSAATAASIISSWTLRRRRAPDPSPGPRASPRSRSRVLGGLLLNLMPCVLPVLALKAFAVARAVRAAADARRWPRARPTQAAYSLSMLALGAVGARAARPRGTRWAGASSSSRRASWRSSRCCAWRSRSTCSACSRSASCRAASPPSAPRPCGARRSFFEGLLAVASRRRARHRSSAPRSASRSPAAAPFVVAIFVAIGLGLAAPFVADQRASRGAARWLPRSGAVDERAAQPSSASRCSRRWSGSRG